MEVYTILSLCILLLILSFILFIFFADADLILLFYHSFLTKKDFQNKVVWITGSSSGIGESLAYSLAKRHAKLALSGVNIKRLENVKRHCIEISNCMDNDILLVPFSIEKFELHEDCVKKVLDHFDHIDILVNNAGIAQSADFIDIDMEVDLHLFNVNVFGPLNLTRKVLSHFLERKEGHFVVTSSISGKLAYPYTAAYTASKHALHGYFECLRSEMVDNDNIHVTMVCPGPIWTPIMDSCITGKLGEKHGYRPKPSNTIMNSKRCSELMVTAIAFKLDECWISKQPILLLYYVGQYIPSIFRNSLQKYIYNKKILAQMTQ